MNDVIEAASETDRQWFKDHPKANIVYRIGEHGEFPNEEPGVQSLVCVVQHAPGIRMRQQIAMTRKPWQAGVYVHAGFVDRVARLAGFDIDNNANEEIQAVSAALILKTVPGASYAVLKDLLNRGMNFNQAMDVLVMDTEVTQ